MAAKKPDYRISFVGGGGETRISVSRVGTKLGYWNEELLCEIPMRDAALAILRSVNRKKREA